MQRIDITRSQFHRSYLYLSARTIVHGCCDFFCDCRVKRPQRRLNSLLHWVFASFVLAQLVVLPRPANAEITFEEVTELAGIDNTGETWGASWGDFNGDGNPDIFVSNHRRPASLYVNQGDGTFVDVAAQVLVSTPGASIDTHGAAWADFDNDGDLDLMLEVGAFKRPIPNLFYVNAAGQLQDRASLWGLDYPEHLGRTPQWLDFNNDGSLDLILAGFDRPDTPGVGNTELFENSGDVFHKKSQEVGFDCSGKTLFATMADVSGDGVLDILCATGATFPKTAFDPTTLPFTDISEQIPKTTEAYDVAIADYNNDLRTDIFVLRRDRKNNLPITSRVLLNSTSGWQEHTASSGMDDAVICKSVVAADFDNDMDLDIYRVCSSENRENILSENSGVGVFTTVPGAGGAPGSAEGIGDTAVVADYDGDGFLDIFVTNGEGSNPSLPRGPHQLYRNTSGDQPDGAAQVNHWMGFDLKGTVSNVQGIGARILVTAGAVTQQRENNGGMHLFSQNDWRLHFGLGPNSSADQVTIVWPSGIIQTFENVQANRYYRISETVDQQAGRVGGIVWNDANNDGIQDGDESSMSDMTVQLYDCDDVMLNTGTTDSTGGYIFNSLVDGNYRVGFVVPNGWDFSSQSQGTEDELDSDANPSSGLTQCMSVVAGEYRTNIDAGISYTGAGACSIGDFVWDDVNGNGVQDQGEVGLSGVTLNLLNCDGSLVETTITDADGLYAFDNLAEGGYQVEVELPVGSKLSPRFQGDRAIDSNLNPVNAKTGCMDIASGQHRNGIDVGLVLEDFPLSTSIGDLVWEDLNGDGIQDLGEPGFAGAKVNLLDCSSNSQIDSTTTNADGNYTFADLALGNLYRVEFETPVGFAISPRFQASNDQDSNPNPVTKITRCLNVLDGQHRFGVDAGMIAQ